MLAPSFRSAASSPRARLSLPWSTRAFEATRAPLAGAAASVLLFLFLAPPLALVPLAAWLYFALRELQRRRRGVELRAVAGSLELSAPDREASVPLPSLRAVKLEPARLRVVLELERGASLPLTESFATESEGSAAQRSVLRFLRAQGWSPREDAEASNPGALPHEEPPARDEAPAEKEPWNDDPSPRSPRVHALR